jgi:hypothetical protein
MVTGDGRIGRSLIITAARVHPHLLWLLGLILAGEILCAQPVLICFRLLMCQAFEEGLRTSEELTRFADVVHAETTLDQMCGFAEKLHAGFDIVQHGNIAIFVTSIDVWQFDSRTTVAAVEDDEKGAVGRHGCDKGTMEDSAGDLAVSCLSC